MEFKVQNSRKWKKVKNEKRKSVFLYHGLAVMASDKRRKKKTDEVLTGLTKTVL